MGKNRRMPIIWLHVIVIFHDKGDGGCWIPPIDPGGRGQDQDGHTEGGIRQGRSQEAPFWDQSTSTCYQNPWPQVMNSQKGQSVHCPSWKCSKSSKIFSQKTVLRYFKRQMSYTTMLYCMLYCIYIYIYSRWVDLYQQFLGPLTSKHRFTYLGYNLTQWTINHL